ncbi:La-related protein 6B [Sesamum angolense]|uniref:La-related protein 6B n=1 Tax=Sesamum angolense TaxID=2727404 RepID=A0AAE2BJN3_9LAMI|nr:La-related protein 6B [Sesamum angolense]
MDQEQSSEALTPSSSVGTKKLNAEAPEFVPRVSSAATPPPPPPLLPPVYARPPSFVPPLPAPYYGYENYYQQNLPPFYGYNVNPVGPVEFAADGKVGSTATSTKNGLCDSHQKIINQVEFYFSDINLATTDQLFRYMSKDPEGYVPLSVVASFKKIKTAISDSTQLASILRSSNKLLVSEDGKKVKRQHPLTESDMEELQSRIVIAENLPEDHSHQNLMKIFSSVGSVKSIRTCPPQNSNTGASYASKAGKGDGLHFSGKFHAFVEYESAEVAERAVAELKDDGNWRNCLKVRLLLKNVVKPTHTRAKKVVHEGQSTVKKDEIVVAEMQGFKENHLEDTVRQSDKQNHELQLEDTAKSNGQKKGRSSVGGNGNGNGKGKGKGQSRGRPQHPTNGGNISASPSLEVSSSNEKLNITKASSVPRMPDGTKGFSMGRGKPVAVRIA